MSSLRRAPLVSGRCGTFQWTCEAGETPSEALSRELEEELSILIGEPGPLLASVEAGIAMHIWLVEDWPGTAVNVSAADHDDLGWFTQPEARNCYLMLGHPRKARCS
jgi:8-oxo-dGTP pyrophosphatase MutT (NUDIX family)